MKVGGQVVRLAVMIGGRRQRFVAHIASIAHVAEFAGLVGLVHRGQPLLAGGRVIDCARCGRFTGERGVGDSRRDLVTRIAFGLLRIGDGGAEEVERREESRAQRLTVIGSVVRSFDEPAQRSVQRREDRVGQPVERHQQRDRIGLDDVVGGVGVLVELVVVAAGLLGELQILAGELELSVAVHQHDSHQCVGDRDRIPQIGREVGPAVVLAHDVDREITVGRCGAAEGDVDERDRQPPEPLHDPAVGPTRVAHQNIGVADMGGLVQRCRDRTLGEAEDHVALSSLLIGQQLRPLHHRIVVAQVGEAAVGERPETGVVRDLLV